MFKSCELICIKFSGRPPDLVTSPSTMYLSSYLTHKEKLTNIKTEKKEKDNS